VLGAGDHIRVGKLDFELLVGELEAEKRGDSSQALAGVDASTSETTPLAVSDTSFEIPVPSVPEDTGSSILAPESLTPVPTSPVPAGHNGDTTVVWSPQAAPGYGAEMYPPMGMPYQPPYQPAYNPYMPPGMGYQPYPQMPMGYPGMYPQMGGYGAPAPTYAPQPPQQQQPAAAAEPAQADEPVSMPSVRLPDPKTTGAKAPDPPPAPAPAPEPEKPVEESLDPNNPSPFGAQKPAVNANAKPAENAADILKKYTQRRPV
jgi:hypothetical protein